MSRTTQKEVDKSLSENIAREVTERKKRGSKSASIQANNSATPNEITSAINESLQYFKRPCVQSDEECAERLNEYFQNCADTGQIPSVENMCLALGTIRQRVWDWEQGSKGDTRKDMVKKAKELIAAVEANLAQKGKVQPVTYIFRAKNYYGMKDQAEVIVTPNNPLGAESNAEEVQKRIDAGVVIDAETLERIE